MSCIDIIYRVEEFVKMVFQEIFESLLGENMLVE